MPETSHNENRTKIIKIISIPMTRSSEFSKSLTFEYLLKQHNLLKNVYLDGRFQFNNDVKSFFPRRSSFKSHPPFAEFGLLKYIYSAFCSGGHKIFENLHLSRVVLVMIEHVRVSRKCVGNEINQLTNFGGFFQEKGVQLQG